MGNTRREAPIAASQNAYAEASKLDRGEAGLSSRAGGMVAFQEGRGDRPREGERLKRLVITVGLLALPLLVFVGSSAIAGHKDGGNNVSAALRGFEEVPAVSSTGQGTFAAQISSDKITYTLTYSGLEAAATVAHIHFGQPSVAGGVIAFLCGGGGTPTCPASGTVTGTITAANIIGPTDQGIAPGEFAEAVAAIRAGVAYVNVHSAKFPNGEIRGQLAGRHGNHGENGHEHGHNGHHDNDDDDD
jgi:hypothetical protein